MYVSRTCVRNSIIFSRRARSQRGNKIQIEINFRDRGLLPMTKCSSYFCFCVILFIIVCVSENIIRKTYFSIHFALKMLTLV